YCRTDVSRTADMARLIDFAVERFGVIDIMVNNAGISHANQPMLNVSEEEFDRIYAVNVKSIYLSAVHCVPVFRRQGSGCFINIASTAGVRPGPGRSCDYGSHGGAVLLRKSVAAGLANETIVVTAVKPARG